MALKTLLKRNWTPKLLQKLPVLFLTDTLLPALMSPVHHRVAAAGGLSATGGAVAGTEPQQPQAVVTAAGTAAAGDTAGGFNVISQAGVLLSAYVAAAGPAAARALLAGGIRVAAKPGQDLPRSGLLAVLRALAAAAGTAAAGGSMLRDMTNDDAGEKFAVVCLAAPMQPCLHTFWADQQPLP